MGSCGDYVAIKKMSLNKITEIKTIYANESSKEGTQNRGVELGGVVV